MNSQKLPAIKKIALVAHDKRKNTMVAWVKKHLEELKNHQLYATGSTGKLITDQTGLKVECLLSGPLGGDQQIGAMIATRKLDMLIFFWDPMNAQPHDPDVKALLRIGVVWNIPMASNEATADFLFTSSLVNAEYTTVNPEV